MHKKIENTPQQTKYDPVELASRGARQSKRGNRREESQDHGDQASDEYKSLCEHFHVSDYNRVVAEYGSGAILGVVNIFTAFPREFNISRRGLWTR